MNLNELMVASLLKLLPNNDVQARLRSHACFFARVRLFVPDNVHSSLSRKIFSGCSSCLTLCRSATQLTSQPPTSGSQKKNRRHTPSNEHVSVVNLSAGNCAEDTPASTNSANYCEVIKISGPHGSRRYHPIGTSRLNLFLSGVTNR